jgi:hypothetical protein
VRSLSNAEMKLLKFKEDQVRSLSNAEMELLNAAVRHEGVWKRPTHSFPSLCM